MSGAGERAGAPVHIDDALFDADLARLPETARTALQTARRRYEQDGVPASRIVFQVAWLAEDTLGLEYVAAGLAHPPEGARRRSVYELAHYRLHGSWPRR